MHEVIMPKLGLTMEAGTIEKWHKKEGEKVETGEILFEVMTDKVSLEVEAYNSGTLLKILKNEGDEVPVTEVIAYIGSPDEKFSGGAPRKGDDAPEAKAEDSTKTEPELSVEKKPAGAGIESKAGNRDIKISPLARRIAEAKGVDMTMLKGTGPGGRIVKEDVEKFVGASPEKKETTVAPPGRIKISPLAKKLAKELSIDMAMLKGTGPGGRIVKEDIENYAKEEKQPAIAAAPIIKPAAGVSVPMVAAKVKSSTPLKGIRKIIAERLTYSKQNIPHIISTVVIDVASLVEIREKIKERVSSVYGVKITITDFIIKAVAQVLAEQPVINSSLVGEDHIIYEDVNVGLAVATDAGLIVPTIYGAASLNLFDIALKRAELVEKTKKSQLKIEEISNGTFTISNLGMFGIRNFTAIINPPQGAILSVGEVYKEPAVINDRIDIGTFMQVSLAVDHRIIDGADGARYLQRLKELLESPELLLI